jgi:predicted RNA methylase
MPACDNGIGEEADERHPCVDIVPREQVEFGFTRNDRSKIMRLAMAIATLFLGVAVQAQPFTVAITSSDDPALAAPAARVYTLTTAQVEQMVRRAVHMAGGFSDVIADTARLVVQRPAAHHSSTNGTLSAPNGRERWTR